MKPRDPKYSLLFPPSGGYRKLKSFQVSQLLYDVTVRFIDHYVPRNSRTHDQMEQAARSGVQNIAEGSVFSATSKKFEMNLTNVAKSSIAELKLDYEDLLRHRKLPLWEKNDPRRAELVALRCSTADEVALWIRSIWKQEHEVRSTAIKTATARTPATIRDQAYVEIAANAAHILCGVAITLLDRQLTSLAKTFENEGGFSERLYKVRTQARKE